MSKDVDPKVTREQLLEQLSDAVNKYKATKASGKGNVSRQTIENRQKTIFFVTDMQKRLELLKGLKST